jgi:hypothetical protein
VKQDLVEAYAWLTVAVLHGDDDAELLRNHVAVDMTEAEFNEGKCCAARHEEDVRAAMQHTVSH